MQAQNLTLVDSDLRSLMRHCIKSRHGFMKDITTRAKAWVLGVGKGGNVHPNAPTAPPNRHISSQPQETSHFGSTRDRKGYTGEKSPMFDKRTQCKTETIYEA